MFSFVPRYIYIYTDRMIYNSTSSSDGKNLWWHENFTQYNTGDKGSTIFYFLLNNIVFSWYVTSTYSNAREIQMNLEDTKYWYYGW